MSTATMTLTAFLLARIAEDETELNEEKNGIDWLRSDEAAREMHGHFIVQHVDRLLAECHAKRRIIEEHSELVNPIEGVVYCRMCICDTGWASSGMDFKGQRYPCRTLRALAVPYADHPEYRDEWRPAEVA